MSETGTKLTLRDAVNELEQQYDGIAEQFAVALPPHVSAKKFKGVVVTAVNLQPDLLRADRRSLFNSCLKAAADGLLPDGREGFLNVYNQKVKEGDKDKWIKAVQWQPMVFGIIKRIRQSGEISSVGARMVYEKEMEIDPATDKPRFQFIIDDDGERVVHNPIIFGERGKPIGCYAYAKFKDGTREFEPLSLADIEKIRDKSRAAKSGPWVDWFEEMAKKSAIRRLSKRLPLSSEIVSAVMRDEPVAEIDHIRAEHRNAAMAQLSAPVERDDDPPHEVDEALQRIEEIEGLQDTGFSLADIEATVERAKAGLKEPGMTKVDLHEFGDHIKSIIANAAITPEDKKRLVGEFNASYLAQLKALQ